MRPPARSPNVEETVRILLALLLVFLIGLQLVVKDEVDAVVGALVAGLLILALLPRLTEVQRPMGLGLKMAEEVGASSAVQEAVRRLDSLDDIDEEETAKGLPDSLKSEARDDPQHTVAATALMLRRRIATLDATIRGRQYPIDHPGVVAQLQRRGIVQPEVAELCERILVVADQFLLLDEPERRDALDIVDLLDRAFRALRPLALLDNAARAHFTQRGWQIATQPQEGSRRPDFVATKDGEESIRIKTVYTTLESSQLPWTNARRLEGTDAERAAVVLPHGTRYGPLPLPVSDRVTIISLEELEEDVLTPGRPPANGAPATSGPPAPVEQTA